MSDQVCCLCGKLLKDGDEVRATVLAHFVGLKSKVHYAISKPSHCETIAHKNCQFPAGTEDELEGVYPEDENEETNN